MKHSLRADALAVLKAGMDAVRTTDVVNTKVKRIGNRLVVDGQIFDLKKFGRVYLIGIGKAAFDAAKELEGLLGDSLTDGVVLDVKRGKLKKVKSIAGTHPLPSMSNIRATGDILGILKSLREDDLVIAIISGGGSALLCWPYSITCDQVSMITQAMMNAGADIHEMNTVRKHLSEVQGGQLAAMAAPATVLGLIFSDVPGDDIGVVASGPTVMDTTTVADAERIMKHHDLLKLCRMPACELRETPKDPHIFRNVTNILLVNNAKAVEAMGKEAKRRGYALRVYGTSVSGEAREVGRLLAGLPRPGEMVIAAGETTVTLKGKGKGGRNQELVLGALPHIEDDSLVISCASDGIDNTPVAGAIADVTVAAKAKRLKLDPEKYLADNDAYTFFKKVGSQIKTGITGANVSDLMLAARSKR